MCLCVLEGGSGWRRHLITPTLGQRSRLLHDEAVMTPDRVESLSSLLSLLGPYPSVSGVGSVAEVPG